MILEESSNLPPQAGGTPAKWRDDTTLEAAGAEMLVVGRLLIDGFQVYRAYANQPGYDALVVNPKTSKQVKVQVKSRVAEDSGRFRIEHPDFDFAVFVRLNRGTKAQRKEGVRTKRRDPIFYILSKKDVCAVAQVEEGLWTSKRDFRISQSELVERECEACWEHIWEALDRKTGLPPAHVEEGK